MESKCSNMWGVRYGRRVQSAGGPESWVVDDPQAVDLARRLGVYRAGVAELDAIDVLGLLDLLREQGLVLLFKWDGERESHWFTVLISGPGIDRDEFTRTEESTPGRAIGRALAALVALPWAARLDA